MIDRAHDLPVVRQASLLRLSRSGVYSVPRPVATLMRRMGIEALYRRPCRSKPAPGHKIYPYLLRNRVVDRPNQVWAMDITYIPMARGFVYLAAVVDWFSRRVLAWRLSITLEAEFCLDAIQEALAAFEPGRENAGAGLSRPPDASHGSMTPSSAPAKRAHQPAAMPPIGTETP